MSEKECTGCKGQSTCQGHDQKGQQEDEQLEQSMTRIKNKLVVLSGKGGVGKSSVAANIAVGLSMDGYKVGLLDVDVHGPSIPRLLSLEGSRPQASQNVLLPIKWSDNLSVMSLGFMLPHQDDSVIWRGPLKMRLIRQFLGEVSWGDLDYLIVDCPPGTGDEPISVLQLIGKSAQAVIVTTPQVLAIDDVRRSVNFCHHTGNPILGIVENMSGLICPYCQKTIDVFNSGGGEELAKQTGVPFLGRIPLDPEMVRSGDQGYVFFKTHREDPAGQAINEILEPIRALCLQKKDTQLENSSEQILEEKLTAKSDGNLKIAIPVSNGKLATHFGHCEQFALLSINKENKNIEDVVMLTPPPHEPGVLPAWLAEKEAKVVITGGMGMKAQNHFKEKGVEVVTGAESGTPEEIVQAYLNGTLRTGENLCDH